MSLLRTGLLRLCLTVAFVYVDAYTAAAQDIFNDTILHEIRIKISQSNWFDTLDKWYYEALDGAPKQFLSAGITIDGTKLSKESGIRFKGQYSYTGFPGKKKPFRIHFNKISDKQDFQGIKKINLHNFAGDPSFLREYVSYGLMRLAGIAAPRVSYTKLYINDIYWGCYLVVEEPEDKLFLKQNFGTDEGNLFDNADDTRLEWKGKKIASYPEMKLQSKDKTGAWDNLLRWIELFNTNFNYDFQQQLSAVFDVDNYMKILATDVLLNNWDSYADNGRNFFIYDNPVTGKLQWIPWDYNLAMWKKNLALFPKDGDSKYNYKPLIWRLHDNDYLREKYYRTVCNLLNNEWHTYPAEEKTKAIASLISVAVEADTMKFYSNDAFYKNRTEGVVVNMLRNYVPTDVWLPGITSLLQSRQDTLKASLLANKCDCSKITKDAAMPGIYIKTFPNPVVNTLDIYTEEAKDSEATATILLYDELGREVMNIESELTLGSAHADVSTLPQGMYIMRLITNNKTTITKLLKQ